MRRSTWHRLVVVAAAGVAAGGAPAQTADVQALRLRSLAATCAPCHGTTGHPVEGDSVPALAGQPASFLVGRLAEFKNGTRVATVMPQIARGFSDAQIEQLAAYFAAQPK